MILLLTIGSALCCRELLQLLLVFLSFIFLAGSPVDLHEKPVRLPKPVIVARFAINLNRLFGKSWPRG